MKKKEPPIISRYGLDWDDAWTDLDIELECIRRGGQWNEAGKVFGEGLFHHWVAAQKLLFPEKVWHKWNILETECYLNYRVISELGAASSGKSATAATNVLLDYYLYPDSTTVLVSSTEIEMLKMRIWGEIIFWHRQAKRLWPELPGYHIESSNRIVTDKSDPGGEEARDVRNGLVAVPAKRGETWVLSSSFQGVKNKHVRVVFDEAALMPATVVDVIANLGKNPDFKAMALGNPLRTTDALGRLAEPRDGGWESGIDQTGGTKTWLTRMDEGIAIQLVGTDSPNLDGKLGIPLITQKQIDADLRFYGPDSLQFTSMNAARMPRGEGTRRVLTREICLQHGAFEKPIWKGTTITRIGSLDAAYGNVGGDRAIFVSMEFGLDVNGKQIVALGDVLVVPVSVRSEQTPEDQIVSYCRSQCEARGILPQNFFYDAGMRTSLVMAFSRLWTPNVNSIDSMGAPTERPVDATLFVMDKGKRRLKTCREHYSKLVSEFWFSVRYAVEAGQLRGMTEDLLLEASQREWGMVSGNKIELESKLDMKKRVGRSPDSFDCVTYGLEGARRLGFTISRLAPEEKTEEDHRWRWDLRERAKALRRSFELTYS